jgi:hypothetical protein
MSLLVDRLTLIKASFIIIANIMAINTKSHNYN